MFKIDSDYYKNFGYQTEYMLSFYPLENEEKIINSLDINIDNIIIYKNIGIFFYYKGVIVKVIKSKNIEIESSNQIFKIKYDDFSMLNQIILYYNIKENKQKNNFKIGDLVIPSNIEYPSDDRTITMGDFCLKLSIVLSKKKDMNYDEKINIVNTIFNLFSYKIIDIIEMDNIYFYLLKIENKNNLLMEEDINKDKIVEQIYSLDEDIIKKEDLCNFLK